VSQFLRDLRSRARRRGARHPVAIGHENDLTVALGDLAVERIESREGESGEATLAHAASLLGAGDLDGVVAGAERTTADVIRAGLEFVGKAPGIETISSSFYMVLYKRTGGGEEVLTFTDPAVVPSPSPEQMAESADAACRARRAIVGDQPKAAFLSFSTGGSAASPEVERVQVAVERFRERCPEVLADGELQGDAALEPDVARRKAPGSRLAGRANVLVFPNLDAANIAYKLVERLAGARALGPILQGFRRPLNDLSRGASVTDIVEVACITALMADGDDGE
jgi:phosphate acetyltransferase